MAMWMEEWRCWDAFGGERRWNVQEEVEEGGAADGGGIVQGEGGAA